ncbi:MAG: hypothetical protein ACOC97_04700 [Myxococcota bacterium]
MRRAHVFRVALAAAWLAAASCGDGDGGNGDDPTAVVVLIDVPEAVRALPDVQVEVTVSARAAEDTTYAEVDSFTWINDEEHWPLVIPLEPLEGDPARQWRVEARAETDDGVLGAVGEGHYVNHEVRQLELCMAPCEPESCAVQGGDPADFPRFDGIPETLDCSESSLPRCGDGNLDDGEECDDGNDVAGDGCTPDCREGIVFPELIADNGPAAYDCAPTAPPSGGPVMFTLAVRDFYGDVLDQPICVSIYHDNVIPSGTDCTGGDTSDEGQIEFIDDDGGWFAYRAHATSWSGDDLLAVVEPNKAAPSSGDEVRGTSVRTETADRLAEGMGRARDPDAGLVFGSVHDCNGNRVEGAVVRLTRNGEMISEGPRDLDTGYGFIDREGMPVDRDTTDPSGRFLAVNVPPDDEAPLAVACGIRPGATEPSVIGCEPIPVFADTVSAIEIGPVRTDGPTCPDICRDL